MIFSSYACIRISAYLVVYVLAMFHGHTWLTRYFLKTQKTKKREKKNQSSIELKRNLNKIGVGVDENIRELVCRVIWIDGRIYIVILNEITTPST